MNRTERFVIVTRPGWTRTKPSWLTDVFSLTEATSKAGDCARTAHASARDERLVMLSPRPRFLNQVRDSIELLIGQLRPLAAENGRDGVFRRAVEERVDEMPQGGLARGAARNGGRVHVA